MEMMTYYRQVAFGLAAIVVASFLAGCAENTTTKQPETPKQKYVKVASPSELVAGQVLLVTRKKFNGTFSLYPVGAPELGEIDTPEGTTYVLVDDITQAVIGNWDIEEMFNDSSDLVTLAVLDINANSLFVDPSTFDILDIHDLISPDDFTWGGVGCCTMCVTRPDGSKMCFSVCRGCP